jgi:hypothetical protein
MAKYIGNQPDITVNGVYPDASGTFNLSLDDLNVASRTHLHNIADITGLQALLDSKANINHVHDYITGFNIDGDSVSGTIVLNVDGDLAASAAGNVITLTSRAPTVGTTVGLTDASDNTTEVRTFVGTQAEWDAYTPDPAVKYLVYIHP